MRFLSYHTLGDANNEIVWYLGSNPKLQKPAFSALEVNRKAICLFKSDERHSLPDRRFLAWTYVSNMPRIIRSQRSSIWTWWTMSSKMSFNAFKLRFDDDPLASQHIQLIFNLSLDKWCLFYSIVTSEFKQKKLHRNSDPEHLHNLAIVSLSFMTSSEIS